MTTARHDPRLYQIAALSALLTLGIVWLDFEFHLGEPSLSSLVHSLRSGARAAGAPSRSIRAVH